MTDDSSLATQCLALCQSLTSQGMVFNFSLAIGSTFSFSVDTKSKEALPIKAKKKVSPSTRKRNMRRREEFLKKKSIPYPLKSRKVNLTRKPVRVPLFNVTNVRMFSEMKKV